ncbi:MAG: plastocyanin/azurin family copper-binding protein [Actinomycetota bacterium]
MPRWVKVFVIVAVVLLVVVVIGLLTGQLGPGGPHGPGRHLGARSNATPASAQQQNTGNVGGPAAASEASRTIEVTLLDTMSFEPASINVSAGETVTFAVTNAGRDVHEFTLGDAAMHQEHAQAMAHIPAGVTHSFPNSLTLQPGETKRLTWRFGDAALEFACHERGHYEAGMRGQVMVI